MNKYLKKYQNQGEVKKLSYNEWCSENNELCRSDANKAKALYQQYSNAHDMQNWSVSFNQSVSFGDTETGQQNLSNEVIVPQRQWGFIQPESAWTNSIAGPVTPLDVLPGVMQMGNAFKELFTPDPYRQAIRQERRRLRKLNKEEYGGSFQMGGDLWDDDSSDDVEYGPFPEDYYDGDDAWDEPEDIDLDPDDDDLPMGIDATPYGDDGPDFSDDDDDDDDDETFGDTDFGDDDDYDYDYDDDETQNTGRSSGPPPEQQGEKKKFWDRKVPKFFRKFSHGLVTAAKPINALLRMRETERQMELQNMGTVAGNMFAATPADISGDRGDWTTNEGFFRPDDRVISRWGRYGLEMPEGESLPKADDGREWLENNYPGYDDLTTSQKAQLQWDMKGTTYNFHEDLYNFQNPMNRNPVTNTMSYPFPEWMREYDNRPNVNRKNFDFNEYNQSWDDNPNKDKYYKHRWSQYGDWNIPGAGGGWGNSENMNVWYGGGTSVTDPITGKETNWRKGPWEGFHSGYSWMPESGEITLNEADWNLLVETGAYDPRRIDERGRWSRSRNEYINKHSDRYMIWEEVLQRNYPELTTMQIHDLMHAGVHRDSMRGGRKGSPWAAGIPTPHRMKQEGYQWGEYGDLLFDIKTTMPPSERSEVPFVIPTDEEEILVNNTGRNQTPISIPTRGFTGVNTIPNPVINPVINPGVNPIINPGVNPIVNPVVTTTTTTGDDDGYIPSRDYGYIPQTQRSRDEMNATAYGTSGSPQSQQDDDDTAYVPQTQRDDDDDEAKYGGFFYGNGGEAEIDINTYKQLIAAGADIQIL